MKIWKRLSIASLYGASQSINNLIRFFTSWLIFQYDSPNLWGAFIKINLAIQLISMITGLGQRDYVLKLFSFDPQNTHSNWGANMATRLPILFLGLIGLFFFLDSELFILSALWLVAHHLNNSFQVIVLYERDFKFALFVEIIAGLLLPLVVFFYIKDLSLQVIILGVLLGMVFKMGLFSLRYNSFLNLKLFVFSSAHLKESTTYFLPSLIGTVQSRVDTYFIAAYLENSTLAYYNIFMSFLNFSYNLMNFTIAPFIKNLYRMKLSSLKKLQISFALIALLFSVIAMGSTKVMIENYYQYDLPNSFYLVGSLSILTFSLYILIINKLFKVGKQKAVALTAFIALLFQAVMSYLVIPLYHLSGALFVYFIGQLLVTAIFLVLDNKLGQSKAQ